MSFADGLKHLDQLQDYVQTSLSSSHNVEPISSENFEFGEESKDVEQIRDTLTMNEIVESIDNDENDEVTEELDLIDLVKEEILYQGEIFLYVHI